MPSNLSHLFRYARAEKMDAKENFTTEALAATIRYDAAPIVALLRARGWLGPDVVAITPYTQVHFPGVGFIDLVLDLRAGDRHSTLWVEVKVDAGEHGNQLSNYLAYIREHAGITLVTLGREPLRDDVEHVEWRELRRVALATAISPTWRDFITFLEEIGMADEYDEPLRGAEIGALTNAYALLRKLSHALEPVGRHANALWPGSAWPQTVDEVRKTLGASFANHRRFTISNTTRTAPAWFVVGVVPAGQDQSSVALHIGVEAKPKDLGTRAALDRLLRSKLPAAWDWPSAEWSVCRARGPVPTEGDLAGVSAWFNNRIDELHAAGLFAQMSTLVQAPPSQDVGDRDP